MLRTDFRVAPRSALGLALQGSLLAGGAFAQEEAWRRLGSSSIPAVGTSVAYVGDTNGDGIADLVAGGPAEIWREPGSGRVLLISGADGSLLHEVAGTTGTGFGTSVAAAGDVDLDGFSDFAVGAPGDGDGSVEIYSGSSGALLRRHVGTSAESRFGQSISNLGDLDGDGFDELAIGAPAHDTGGGRFGLAVIYSGATGGALAQWNGASADGSFGSVVDDAGDFDGDGHHDLLVIEQTDATAGSNVGSLRVYSGATLTLAAQWTLSGTAGGWTVSSAGDVDGDGFADVVVGNRTWPYGSHYYYSWLVYRGGVWVVSGRTGATLHQFWGTTYAETGYSVSGLGDVDGDGFDDFGFGFIDQSSHSAVAVHSGMTGAPISTLSTPTGAFYGFGFAIDGGSDLDGNGVPDVVAGVPWDLTNGWFAGSVAVCDPATRSVVLTAQGTSEVEALGASIALLDDVDGDGRRDLVCAAAPDLFNGSVRILSGADGTQLRRHDGPGPADRYGWAVAALPDVDGDAMVDYAVTRPTLNPTTQPVVELRSGATGALVGNLVSPYASGGFGTSIDVAIQPSTGALHVGVGAPYDAGHFGFAAIYDVATGAIVAQWIGKLAGGQLGYSIAFIGDLNGDGVGDWAAGSPSFSLSHSRAVLFSGKDGAFIKDLVVVGSAGFGAAIAGPGDLDGDGVADLVIGSPLEGTNRRGRIYVYSGKTLKLMRSWDGTRDGEEMGRLVAAISDVNRDGVRDLWSGAPASAASGLPGRACLWSGRTGGLMVRIDGARSDDRFGGAVSRAAPGSDERMDGDSIPDVAVGAPEDATNGHVAGRLSLFALDDLYLEVEPPGAAAGATLTVDTRGGPAGRLAANFLVAIDGSPLLALVAVGTFDAVGTWEVTPVVPAGLSGHTATLRSYAIGFAGKVIDTRDVIVTFL